MNFSFVFVGDTHGFINDFIKQKKVIENINPDFVLSENMQNISLDSKEKYEEILRNEKISNMVFFEEMKEIIEFCYKKDIKLIGMDLENFGFNDNLQRKIKNKENLSKEEEKDIENIMKKREEKNLEKIKEYQEKADKTIVILIGSWHLRENSSLMTSLNNYKVIFPCDDKGNLLIGPTNKNISYCERIKCQKN